MRIRRLTKREKTFVRAVLGTLVIGLAINGGMFLFAKISELNRDIERKTLLLKRHSRLIQRGESIQSLYFNYRGIIDSKNPLEEAGTDLFKKVKSLTQSLNMTVERVMPLPVKERKDYKETALEVELGGDLKAIFQFINRVEDSLLFVKIVSLYICPQGGSGLPLRCKVTLSKLFF